MQPAFNSRQALQGESRYNALSTSAGARGPQMLAEKSRNRIPRRSRRSEKGKEEHTLLTTVPSPTGCAREATIAGCSPHRRR
jgi:hypothetical protein